MACFLGSGERLTLYAERAVYTIVVIGLKYFIKLSIALGYLFMIICSDVFIITF
jgi:hypothetical protein